ncbi:TonB-dependent receptor plug domain-containing protein [Oleiharenicola lentus]|uniref:TonB-dependent receptor plug domain-containing protein n=1 Tax=Oleiharenicola lentus TaxID=2508720 RepID=UPI003F66B0C7
MLSCVINTLSLREPDRLRGRRRGAILAIATFAAAWAMPAVQAQTTPASDEKKKSEEKKSEEKAHGEVLQLAPFQVSTSKDVGYAATSSLAGSRLNTELKDVASAIQVVTAEFMKDTGSSNLQDILVYTTSTEVAGIGGNYYGGNAEDGSYRARMLVNPQSGTRVRGLDTADLTRNFYSTGIPMDSYNTSRVDIQRGPNSILFGLGSPAGIINNTLKEPDLDKFGGEAQFRIGSYGSYRQVLDVDVPLVKNQLGLRISGLNDQEKFRQDFTFNKDRRLYGALRWQPKLAQGVFTQIDIKGETGRINANRPVPVTAADFISNWFGPLNKYLMYNPLTNNGTPQEPNGTSHPELRHYFAGAPARDWWNDSPGTIYQNPTTGAIGNGRMDAYRQRDGDPWGGLSGVTNPNLDEGGPGAWNKDTAAYFANNAAITKIINDYQKATGKTFTGFGTSVWPQQMILSGPLAFIDQTMSGPNKKEWNNFDSIDLSGSQTYFSDRLGFNVGYYKESYRSGYANLIDSPRVTVDVNATLRDDGPNPDVGRPYIVSPSSGNMKREDREAWRATAYYKLDAADYLARDSWLARILGNHTFTGVVTNQRYDNLDRSFNLYAWDAATLGTPFLNSVSHTQWWGVHYIGENLQKYPSFNAIPSSAIHGISASHTPPAAGKALIFDNNTKTWHTANLKLLSWETISTSSTRALARVTTTRGPTPWSGRARCWTVLSSRSWAGARTSLSVRRRRISTSGMPTTFPCPSARNGTTLAPPPSWRTSNAAVGARCCTRSRSSRCSSRSCRRASPSA